MHVYEDLGQVGSFGCAHYSLSTLDLRNIGIQSIPENLLRIQTLHNIWIPEYSINITINY